MPARRSASSPERSAGFAATDLGGFAIKAALERAGVAPDQVDYVFMGQVLQAGTGQITARQAAANAGIPMTVPATTVNKVCLSGLNTIYLADLLIQAGEADIVVAGGMESMTKAPYLLPGRPRGLPARRQVGRRLDDVRRPVLRLRPGGHGRRHREVRGVRRPRAGPAGRPRRQVARAGRGRHQGGPLRRRDRAGRGPAAQGRPARGRHRRGRAARHHGRVAGRAAAGVRQGRQHHRRQRRRRSPTAAPPSIVASKAAAERLGLGTLGEVVGYGQVAGPDPSLLTQPSRAINAALEGAGKSVGDVDLFELNEAFAAVGLASMQDLGITDDVVNVNGGAIALGHPVGMSGTRVALTLLHELKRRGGGLGAAALCGGGGQGDAILLSVSNN